MKLAKLLTTNITTATVSRAMAWASYAAVWRRLRRVAVRAVAVAVMIIVTLFACDRLAWLAAPWMPANAVRAMSTHAQIRRVKVNASASPWIFADHIRYAKPGADVAGAVADEYGYRNPSRLLAGAGQIDVLLLGDSFVWGTERQTIADHMRDVMPAQVVYSAGMGAEGPPQWRHHYRHVRDTTGLRAKTVALNYYSGTDVGDTEYWRMLERRSTPVNSADYVGFLGNRDAMNDSRWRRHATLMEVRSLWSSLTRRSADDDRDRAVVPSLPGADFRIRREPNPARMAAVVPDAIAECVATIRADDPDVRIVLSYIPASASLYGGAIVNLDLPEREVSRQRDGSAMLRDFASGIGIEYVDVTPRLQALAADEVLWSDTHFSPAGYLAYGRALADAVQ